MSGIIGAEIASIEGSSTSVDQYYLLASSVVLYYDFIITIPQEIRYLWSSKLKLMNVLIMMLRYITVLGYIVVLVTAFAPVIIAGTTITCRRMGLLPGIIGVICQGLTLVFLIIRLFAIYDKKRWILYVTLPFGVLSITLSSFAIGASSAHGFGVPSFHLEGFSSCFADPMTREALMVFKTSYIAIILFDTLMFVMALVKTGRMYRAERLNKSRSSIVSILLRDGSVLFAVLAINNITSFILFMPDTAAHPNAVGFVASSGTNSEMTHALSVILVSRMVFNLREAGTEVYEGTQEWRSRVEREVATMRFHVPTSVEDNSSDLVDEPGDNGRPELNAIEEVTA